MRQALLVTIVAVGNAGFTQAAGATPRISSGRLIGTVANGVIALRAPTGDLRWRPPEALRSGVNAATACGHDGLARSTSIPATSRLPHRIGDLGGDAVRFTPEELRDLNAALGRIPVHGARMGQSILSLSNVEAPPKKSSRGGES